MSDYLGLNQTRVLDSTNRSFESITYQVRKPPLSSEVNLGGKIDAERSQNIVQTLMPSGWTVVGQIREDVTASQCQVGDVLCTSDSSNALWFIAQDNGQNTEKNIAMVNGWRIVVQGSSSPTGNGYPAYTNNTENNLIRLPAPPESGSRVDFVFLEVWRKLLTPDDSIYPYGNVDYHGAPFINDLRDPARGFETSLRIQLQYRIRVAEVDDIDLHPEGFCSSVYVQGPLIAPISTCDQANFTQVPGDPGLWMAGAGDSVAQETLQTVDGHTYAIPMFIIRRRNTRAFDPRIGNVNGSAKSLADYKNGLPSDRPDNTYSDWIVADDITDIRHLVGFKNDIGSICNSTFRALQNNNLKTCMGYSECGGEQNGAVLVQVDSISGQPLVDNWSTIVGHGTTPPDGLRRWFANASTDDSVDGTAYPSSGNGLSQVPIKFLEARKIESYPAVMYPIAMKDHDIRVRYGNAALPVNTSDQGTRYNMLRARGGSYFDMYNFGHQMVYHALGSGSTVTINRTIDGYDIIGIASVTTDGTNVQSIVSVTRDASKYTVTLGSSVPSGYDVEMVLYTGNKFFDANKQGRGIIDCYQMTELPTLETPDGVITNFTIDAGSYNIVAIGSYAGNDGTGYAYVETGVNGTSQNIIENNRSFPSGTTQGINFSLPPSGTAIRVPVLLRTAIQSGEGYSFFYNYIPYQGLWDYSGSSVSGSIEAIGPAITTTAGSGGILDYNTGFVSSSVSLDGSKFVYGTGTNWLTTLRSGYLLKYRRYTTVKYFKIKSVISDTLLEMETVTGVTSDPYSIFTFIAPDLPIYSYPNIIDRFPALHSYSDHSGNGEALYPSYSSALDSYVKNATLETKIIMRIQDVIDYPANSVEVGKNDDSVDRGRNMVYLSLGRYGSGALGLQYESVRFDVASVDHYKKTYQSYALNSDGRLYLMVVGSETDNIIPAMGTDGTCWLNPFSTSDVVDLFEIPGRPLVTK